MIRSQSFDMAPTADGNFEVLFCINGKPRRFALCTHEQDAKDILSAMKQVHDSDLQKRIDAQKHTAVPSHCPWIYRGPECGYTGPAVSEPDVCGKTLADCKKRFGNTALPFGGFPGLSPKP